MEEIVLPEGFKFNIPAINRPRTTIEDGAQFSINEVLTLTERTRRWTYSGPFVSEREDVTRSLDRSHGSATFTLRVTQGYLTLAVLNDLDADGPLGWIYKSLKKAFDDALIQKRGVSTEQHKRAQAEAAMQAKSAADKIKEKYRLD